MHYHFLPQRLGVLLPLACSGCAVRPPAHWGPPDTLRQYTISYPSGRPKAVVRREFWYRQAGFVPGQWVSRRITTQEFDTLGRRTSTCIVRERVKQADMTLPPVRCHSVRWSYDSTGRVTSRRGSLSKHGHLVRDRTRPP